MGSYFSQSSSLLDNALILDAKQEHKKTIIWLHGLGDSSEGFRQTFSQRLAHPNIRIVLPNARERPITINRGMNMRAWYDVRGFAKSTVEDDVGINQSCTEIKELLDEECKRVGAGNVILGGFSQGAAMALYTGLQYQEKLAGLVSCSGYIVLHQRYPITNMRKDVPIFAYHGQNDSLIPAALAKQGYDILSGIGVPIAFVQEPGLAHALSQTELKELSEFWINAFKL